MFGLHPVEWNNKSIPPVVTAAKCMFCVAFGREEQNESTDCPVVPLHVSSTKKRKTRQTIKVFGSKFRADNIKKHMEQQHPKQWELYKCTAIESRHLFFSQGKVTAFAVIEKNVGLEIEESIVTVIQNLLCNTRSEQLTWQSLYVCEDYDLSEYQSANDFEVSGQQNKFYVKLKNENQFTFVRELVAISCSFRQVSRIIETAKKTTGQVGKLGCASPGDIGGMVRKLVAINLQQLSVLLKKSWAFSIAMDGATHQSMSYFDIRATFGMNGKLHNFHVMAVPMGEMRHTGANMEKLVLWVFEALDPDFLSKVVGITSDGAANMTGHKEGVRSRIQRLAMDAAGGSNVYVLWCGAHHLNLVVRDFLSSLNDCVEFLKILTKFISFFR